MAQPTWITKHLTIKPEVDKIFNDLDSYLDFCRLELREFNPSHLYDKSNENYRAYLESLRPRKVRQDRRQRNVGTREQNFSH
jgi:hypothetical protein